MTSAVRPPTDLADRYGRRNRLRRGQWIGIYAVGIAVATAFAAWVAIHNAEPFRGEVVGFEITSDQQVRVRLNVYRTEPVQLLCEVYAQAVDKQVVGEKTVTVPASSARTVTLTIDITTSRRATTGALQTCTRA